MVNNRKKSIFALFTVLIAILSLSGATYAWFTNNVTASTNRIETKTSTEGLNLYVSSTGGDNFSKTNICDIVQVNQSNIEVMMPVSTDDLENFLEFDKKTGGFTIATTESSIFHGKIYLKAESTDSSIKKVNIFLEDIDDLFKGDKDSQFLNALRIGLKLDGKTVAIIRPTDDENKEGERIYNTVIDGKEAGDNDVLHWDGEKAVIVSDPSNLPTYYYNENPESVPIANIETNRVYLLDIYMYLEGCDPDCSSYISRNGAMANLSFFAVPEVENE